MVKYICVNSPYSWFSEGRTQEAAAERLYPPGSELSYIDKPLGDVSLTFP